jgi:hypothetical protein
MQQRQPRLGDILDDYCPRERRLTNHVVVAMVGDAVKQTRCTTCESDHEYKHAALPRQRKKSEQSALYSQVLAAVTPKRSVPADAPASEIALAEEAEDEASVPAFPAPPAAGPVPSAAAFDALFAMPSEQDGQEPEPVEEGPLHRRLIRAQLPRHEGQVATTRQAPDFTIRQPNTGRPKRFGGRPPRGGAQFQGNRQGGGMGNSTGGGNTRGGGPRQGGRPQGGGSRPGNRQGGRNRPK